MKESAQTALSFVRSVSTEYGIEKEFFSEHDIHIHIPEGAVPKDGPSAGITMASAMLSAVTGTPARADVAMTGEITLRGRVLPIGGLKEKVLAAKNAGVKTVCIPKQNEKDLEEISAEITKGLSIIQLIILLVSLTKQMPAMMYEALRSVSLSFPHISIIATTAAIKKIHIKCDVVNIFLSSVFHNIIILWVLLYFHFGRIHIHV